MKAVQFNEYGGPEVLQLADAPQPHAGPGQVRIRVRAAGINPIDWKLRKGLLAGFMPVQFPVTTGSDVAGTVDEIGEGVVGVSIGDNVFGMSLTGAVAEFAVLEMYARKPATMSYVDAAGLTMAAETALRGLKFLDGQPGATLLVNGAAGGVGLAVVQIARELGLKVIGTASEANHGGLARLGVIPTLYGPGLVDRVGDLVPGGVDIAYDAAGGGALPDLVALTGSADRVVTIADPAARQLGVRYTAGRTDPRAAEALPLVARLFEAGRFRLPVVETFAMTQVGAAHDLSETGHAGGKLVVLVDHREGAGA